MAVLSLKLNTRDLESKAKRAESALDAVVTQTKRTENELKKLGGSGKELDRLKQKFDPLFAASKRYTREVTQLRTAHRAGAITTDQYNRELVALERSYQRATGAANRLGLVTRGTGGGIQNVAFQVGDFATQVGAGTAASVALGQQLPQLLGGFGALGAVLGAVVAIGVPLAASFFKSADGAKELADAIKTVEESTKSARDELALLNTSLRTVEELRIQQEINDLMEERARLQSQVVTGSIRIDGVSQAQVDKVAEEISLLEDKLQKLDDARSALEAEVGAREEALDRARELSDIERILGEQMAEAARQAGVFAANLAIARDNAMAAAREFTTVQGLRSRFAGEEAVFAQEVVKVGQGEAPPGETQRKIDALLKRLNGGGRGGGRTANSQAREVERIKSAYESLISSLDPVVAKTLEYRDAQNAVKEALSAGVISQEKANRAMELAKERFEEVETNIGPAGNAFKSFFGDIITGAESAEDALANLGTRLASLAANAAFDTLFGSLLGSAFGGIFGGVFGASARGNVFRGGSLTAFAKGGVVDGPTTFPMKNGTGLMGEAGAEAIMPLKRAPGGNLGVEAIGGSVEILVRESDSFLSTIDTRAQGVSVKTMKTGLKQFSRQALPGKVNAISQDSRRVG